jgi:glyoxylase-like metal-dependent hydrolase (beta-lactamase superfamily II)
LSKAQPSKNAPAQAPAPREVVPGVWRITQPLPFPPRHVHVYLVKRPEGHLLIDGGMDLPEPREALRAGLEAAGVEWRDIREIVLTHAHPDHVSLVPEALRLTGATLAVHRLEMEFLSEVRDWERCLAWNREVLAGAGTPSELIDQVAAAFAENLKRFPEVHPEVVLSGGERIGDLDVVWTPGHTSGHVCLYDAGRRALFSGDHVLTDISPNIAWYPGREALREYLDSLDRVAQLPIEVILPSHGEPFTGLPQWVAKTKAHHVQRCEAIRTAMAAGARTPHELVGKLWDRELAPFNYRFAVFEVLSHLQLKGMQAQ